MTSYSIQVSDEERDAFIKTFKLENADAEQKAKAIATSLPGFALGYRAAKQAVQDNEPQKNSEAYYTMDQMREFALGMFTTRLYILLHDIQARATQYDKTAELLKANDNHGAAVIYSQIARDLEKMAEQAKRLGAASFQSRAHTWAKKCFGDKLVKCKTERKARFIEEALELVQAFGMSKREVLGAVKYVFSRPVGDVRQEVGGVYTTLGLLCETNGISMVAEGERDLLEISDAKVTARICEKQKTKPYFGHVEILPMTPNEFLDSLHVATPETFRALTAFNGTMLSRDGNNIYSMFAKALQE